MKWVPFLKSDEKKIHMVLLNGLEYYDAILKEVEKTRIGGVRYSIEIYESIPFDETIIGQRTLVYIGASVHTLQIRSLSIKKTKTLIVGNKVGSRKISKREMVKLMVAHI